MEELFDRLSFTIQHLRLLDAVFSDKNNFTKETKDDYVIYKSHRDRFNEVLEQQGFADELYEEKSRQMILADLYEYIFLGRMYYSLTNQESKEAFTQLILLFVNILMSYENMTVNHTIRRKYLEELIKEVDQIQEEELFDNLVEYEGEIGLPLQPGAPDDFKKLNRYFDKLLPKTAGGLWHELLVYLFILRNNFGYIVPLLLSQRLLGRDDHLVPPDFLIITKDKRIYGVEVGTKKEIQSGSFSLRTAIPTATIDTINSRCSDRCPICKKWIQFCPYVIENYSNFNLELRSIEIKCQEDCGLFNRQDIAKGECRYTKYSRSRAKTLEHTHHDYSNGYHYHYQCVLNNVKKKMRNEIIRAEDNTALKTHFPYYSGLEDLNS